ncbi:MAG TPA: hypothetical protein VJ276_07555, partial [Thermoanaerobaculia bacterium]|nr:hypothetical protein [Thermoanaerobaculia bacterium]
LYRYGSSNPILETDPLGLVSLGPGQKCKGFDRAMKKLQKLKKNCKCIQFFYDQWGVDISQMIDDPNPVVTLVSTGDGLTDCTATTTGFTMNKKYCGRASGGWFGGTTAHILLHEMAHIADCALNRYPPQGTTEEGIAAEVACFGNSVDQSYNPKHPPQPLPPIFFGPPPPTR